MSLAKKLLLAAIVLFSATAISLPSQAANLTVTTVADVHQPGYLTLREAVLEAQPGDTICFASELNGQTILLNVGSGSLIINKNLTITAAKLPSGITIDGNVQGGGSFTIMRMTAGPVSLNKLIITHAGGGFSLGGAIFTQEDVSLTMTDCQIIDNVGYIQAGGVDCRGDLTLLNTSIRDNRSNFGTGGVTVSSNDGDLPSVTITNCTIGNNQSQSATGGLALYVRNASITDSTISENSGFVGGLTFSGTGSTLTVCRSTFTDNVGSANAGGAFSMSGINQDEGPAATFESCTFSKNRANHGDVLWVRGSRVTLQKCSVTDHSGLSNAFITDFGSLILSGCDIRRNGPYSYAVIYHNAELNAQLLVEDSTLSENRASVLRNSMSATARPTILRNSHIERNSGTAIQNDDGRVEIYNCKICGNTATNPFPGVGGIYHYTGTMLIEESTIANNRGPVTGGVLSQVNPFVGQSTLTMNYCTVSNNIATGTGRGGGVSGVNGAHGVFMTLNTCTISGNCCSNGSGGGVYFDSGLTYSELTLKSCTIAENSCKGGTGGGVYVKPLATVKMAVNNTIIARNNDVSQVAPDISASLISQGYNLIGKMDGSDGWIDTDLTGDIDNPLDPVLGKLVNNGGPTATHALLAESPAISTGDSLLAGTRDQRGVIRPRSVDIGAYQTLCRGMG